MVRSNLLEQLWFVLRRKLTSLTNRMGKMVSLMNLVLLQGGKETGEVREDIWLNTCPKCGLSEATAKYVRVQSLTYGKPWTLFRMILS